MCRAVQAQNVSWLNSVHEERQTHSVALREKVGFAMYVGGDVVRSLRFEDG